MFIGKEDVATGHVVEVGSVKFVKHKHGSCVPLDDALELSDATAQALMDGLWRIGIRPTEHGSAGQLAAVEKHLNDMRAIVANRLTGLELPNG